MAPIDWQMPPRTPNSVVLLSHGLNLRPERMEALAALHRAQGAVTGVFVLPGHGSEIVAPGGVDPWDAGVFLRTARDAIEAVRRAKERFAVSRSRFVGVSLGALAVLTALAQSPTPRRTAVGDQAFDDAILLAPALALRRRARLLELPARWLPGWLPIPSFSRPRDRIYAFLPLGAYRVLYHLLADFRRGLSGEAGSGPAADATPLPSQMRIYLDPKDELIHPEGLRSLIREGLLPRAHLVVAPQSTSRPAHLMVDRASLGEALWEDLEAYVENSLRPRTTRSTPS